MQQLTPGEVVLYRVLWGAIAFRYQLQATVFLTAQPFSASPVSATFRRFSRSAASHRFDTRCAAGARSTPGVQPGGQAISLRTLRFLRLTGWPLLTALFSAAAKLKRLSNHLQFWHPASLTAETTAHAPRAIRRTTSRSSGVRRANSIRQARIRGAVRQSSGCPVGARRQ